MIWEAIRTGLIAAVTVWAFIIAVVLPVITLVLVVSDHGREDRRKAIKEGLREGAEIARGE